MANVKNNVSAQETKRKLMDAAGEIFAKVGFERATIKEITDLAGVSMAAVNYHFSDKLELYAQVVQQAHEYGVDKMLVMSRLNNNDISPRDRLRSVIEAMLVNMLDPNQPAWHCELMSREFQTPSPTTERFIEQVIRPFCMSLETLMAEVVAVPMPREKVMLLADSVMGQCLFYVHNRAFHAKLHPEIPAAEDRVAELTDHIASFSLAAIDGLRRQHATTNGATTKARVAPRKRKPARS